MKADIEILWDASPLWGPLLLNAVRQYAEAEGFSFSVVSGRMIAEQGVKSHVLLVPGGSARHKLLGLGRAGAANICDFVAGGGAYVGFCGGAGLALYDSLGLCPWKRSAIQDRMQHLISGHIVCDVAEHAACPGTEQASLPVWWPARFDESGGVSVLARYRSMGPDLYIGDIPVSELTETDFESWVSLYGLDMMPSLLDGHPCVVCGTYGKGSYLLSYSHFETPDSADANGFFASALSYLTGQRIKYHPVTAEFVRNRSSCAAKLGQLLETGTRLGLFFERTPWLYGWRSDVPGSQLNALRMALLTAREDAYMDKDFSLLFDMFLKGARNWLLAKKLASASEAKDTVPPSILAGQKTELFGSPMFGGGMCGDLLARLNACHVGRQDAASGMR
ncbi:MAG: hypothetical protein J5855_09600 [Mailhella sp.]|nr:hypothetical protein [Mailhella sp.]